MILNVLARPLLCFLFPNVTSPCGACCTGRAPVGCWRSLPLFGLRFLARPGPISTCPSALRVSCFPSVCSVSCFRPFVQSQNVIMRFARYKSSQVRVFRCMVIVNGSASSASRTSNTSSTTTSSSSATYHMLLVVQYYY